MNFCCARNRAGSSSSDLEFEPPELLFDIDLGRLQRESSLIFNKLATSGTYLETLTYLT